MIVIAQWDVYRIPLAFRLVKPKASQAYQSEHAMIREMLAEVMLAVWGKKVVVVADAAYPSRANRQDLQAQSVSLGSLAPAHGNWLTANLCAMWLPICRSTVPSSPRSLASPPTRRRVFCASAKQAQLAHVGDITVVVSRRRLIDSPKVASICCCRSDAQHER